jgi:FdhD protein
MKETFRFDGKNLVPADGSAVQEFPLVLRVNDRELATLIASPHDLRFLVAGFLRLQGFVSSVDDFLILSVCTDFGIANVRIRGELPERLRPVLTSGCGTGVTFTLPGSEGTVSRIDSDVRILPPAVFRLMDELAKRAEMYRSHGGVHSCAVGEADGKLLLFAEDIGRHNTLDRIAGEALLRGVDLSGKVLATSGRVSAEMAAKALSLGVSLIASRTSPTDMAIKICRDAGIALVGYVRGGKFNVYAHPERIAVESETPAPAGRIAGATGVILAGGASARMGSNKALLPYRGGRFIESIYRQMAELFPEVLLVTNNPEQYDFLPCRKVTDLYPGMGALAGLHSGLVHASNSRVFAVACDMPYLDPALVRHLAETAEADVVIPESGSGTEPLHSFYSKEVIPAIEEALAAGERRISSFFPAVRVRVVPKAEVARFDPDYRSFYNINTPDEYFRFRSREKDGENDADTLPGQLPAGATP